MDNSLTTNHGTISATSANGYGIWYENDGSARVNNILNNFGTISAIAGTNSDGIGLGKNAQECLIPQLIILVLYQGLTTPY